MELWMSFDLKVTMFFQGRGLGSGVFLRFQKLSKLKRILNLNKRKLVYSVVKLTNKDSSSSGFYAKVMRICKLIDTRNGY